MRIGVVSDIHSNFEAFKAVLDDMPEVDMVLCAGDLVGYGTSPDTVIDEIMENGMRCVKGNHDEAVVTYGNLDGFNRMARKALTHNRDVLSVKNLEFISQLEEKFRETVDGRDVFMVHGSPRRPLEEYVKREDATPEFLNSCFSSCPDILIMGHTHYPFVENVSGTLVLNPGSVGFPRDRDPRASYALIETETLRGEIYRVEYDVEKVAQKVREQISPLLGDRLEKGM